MKTVVLEAKLEDAMALITTLVSAADREDLVGMIHRLNQHYFGSGAEDRDAVTAYVDKALLGPDAGVKAALTREGSTPLGIATFALLYPAPSLTGQLFMKDLFCVKEARNRGVGLALLRFLAAYALDHGCSRFDWTAETTNAPAISFYRHLGIPEVPEKVYFRVKGSRLEELAQRHRD